MRTIDEAGIRTRINGALSLRPQIEKTVDACEKNGIKNVCYLGIGGTYASGLDAAAHMRAYSHREVFAQEAASYNTTGNRRIGEGTLVILSSVSGTTPEVAAAVEKARDAGAFVLGFVDRQDSALARAADVCLSFSGEEQLKFAMTADRLLYLEGAFPEYDRFYAQLDGHLAEDLIRVQKSADAFGKTFAERHAQDPLHCFIGAGNIFGAVYSYAMCYCEEMHWMRTKSVHAGEFFHGTLEIVERDTPVTLVMGEDAERPLGERVRAFIPRVCDNYTVIDTADYTMPGIDRIFRSRLSNYIFHAVFARMDAHLEEVTRHPMEIRRYYRVLDY